MADHELVWEYNASTIGTVTPRPECHADPATADCRIDWGCRCETWFHISRDQDGRPYHPVRDWRPNGALVDAEPEVRHYGKQGGQCLIVVWMENDEELIESNTGLSFFTIGRTPIEPVFTGDYYEWKPEI
jgi:hypothetical protein